MTVVNTLTSKRKSQPQIQSCFSLAVFAFFGRWVSGMPAAYGVAPGRYLFVKLLPHLHAVAVHADITSTESKKKIRKSRQSVQINTAESVS